MEKRMLDTCQHKYVLKQLKKSIIRDLSAILLNFAALLLRLTQTITEIYKNKIPVIFVSKTGNYSYIKLLACTTIWNTLITVLQQAGKLLPIVD